MLTSDFANDGADTEAAAVRAAATPTVTATGDHLRELVRAQMTAQGLTQEAIAREIGRSGSAVNQWLKGKYKGDVGGLERDFQSWLAQNAEAAALGAQTGKQRRFVETPTAATYLATLRYAQAFGDWGVLYGASGTGKTATLNHYAEIRTNAWKATCSPADSTLVPFLKRIARAMDIANPGSGASEITDAIIKKAENTGGLIMVDEIDHVGVTALEQLRYIHDTSGIGVVIAGNDKTYAQLTGGTRRDELARIFSRVGKRQRAQCTAADIAAVADAHGIEGREEIAFLKKIGASRGHLRNVVKVIRQATVRAAGKGEPLSLDHLETTWANLGAEE